MVAKKAKCPERGEIGWLSMKPQAGREQAGRRPVVCLSPASYNRKSGLAIFVRLPPERRAIRSRLRLATRPESTESCLQIS